MSHRTRHRNAQASLRGRRFQLERLEDRIALDAEGGALVAIDPHFTLSFADDGTMVAGETTNLTGVFSFASESLWKEQILRGFQTWAVLTNADIGLVDDGGQAFGAPGSGRGDDRFGDIRVGTIAADPGVGAVSVPVNNLISGTWLADVLFNSEFVYQTDPQIATDELLAIAMHEAGNVFGLTDNNDPTSPLYPFSTTVKTPTTDDIAAIQALHGVRQADANEQHQNDNGSQTDNDTLVSAYKLRAGETDSETKGSAPTVIYGDITTTTDVDYFSIVAPNHYNGPMTVVLKTSGISLLEPQLEILNSSGTQLAFAASSSDGGATLTLELPVTENDTYYFRVAANATDIFGIGGYSLVTTFDNLNQIDPAFTAEIAGGKFRFLPADEIAKLFDASEDSLFNDDGHTDDEAQYGLELETTMGFVNRTRYDVSASIADATDIDFYRFETPDSSVVTSDVMTVAVHSLELAGLVPTIQVLDEYDQPVASQVIANGAGDLVVQVAGVTLGKEYVVSVAAAHPGGPFDTGNYDLQIVFTDTPTQFVPKASGTLNSANETHSYPINIGQPQLVHFLLDAGAAASTSPAAVVVTIFEEIDPNTRQMVARFAAPAGEIRSLPAVLLNPGVYTAEFAAYTLDGSPLTGIDYDLQAAVVSDPFAGDPNDPNGHPFTCEADPGLYCYPGDLPPTNDPFLWGDFTQSLQSPPELPLDELVQTLLGDWWTWVWNEFGVNGPPLAQDDYYVHALGGSTPRINTTAGVLANDFEPEGGSMAAIAETLPAHGTLQLNPDGTFDYVPDPGFVGTDQFTYNAHDFTQSSLTPGVVRIVVTSGLAGDFDGNGLVDMDDYHVWKLTVGSTEELSADGNRDGVVSLADYSIWRDNLGAMLPAAVQLAVVTSSDAQASAPTIAALVVADSTPTEPPAAMVAAPEVATSEPTPVVLSTSTTASVDATTRTSDLLLRRHFAPHTRDSVSATQHHRDEAFAHLGSPAETVADRVPTSLRIRWSSLRRR